MGKYAIRRLILIIPTILIVSLVVFSLLRMLPGDVVEAMVEQNWYASNLDALRKELGLDRPFHVQYLEWMRQVFTGDMGISLWSRQPAMGEILRRAPVTLELGLLAVVISILVALPIGILSAIRQDTWSDYAGRIVAITGISIPSFWLGTMVVVFPSVWFGWMPPVVFTTLLDDPLGNLAQMAIPAVILGFNMGGRMMRMVRTMMLEVLRQDYIRTAWSKGLRERMVISRHAAKNAMIPVVTLLGIELRYAIGGTVILESIFGLPGMGRYLVQVLNLRDFPMVQGVVMFYAFFIILINLLVDLSYSFLDPRIRYG